MCQLYASAKIPLRYFFLTMSACCQTQELRGSHRCDSGLELGVTVFLFHVQPLGLGEEDMAEGSYILIESSASLLYELDPKGG